MGESIPNGWRIMNFSEAKYYKSEITKLLNYWSIVGFDHGKLDGLGYGNKFMEQYGKECHQVVLIKTHHKNRTHHHRGGRPNHHRGGRPHHHRGGRPHHHRGGRQQGGRPHHHRGGRHGPHGHRQGYHDLNQTFNNDEMDQLIENSEFENRGHHNPCQNYHNEKSFRSKRMIYKQEQTNWSNKQWKKCMRHFRMKKIVHGVILIIVFLLSLCLFVKLIKKCSRKNKRERRQNNNQQVEQQYIAASQNQRQIQSPQNQQYYYPVQNYQQTQANQVQQQQPAFVQPMQQFVVYPYTQPAQQQPQQQQKISQENNNLIPRQQQQIYPTIELQKQ